ncbi:hypothetical protein ONZ45_g9756 [Pleurotus djamor]|nr:hypothetical protein ONZ45_g9756 [Pleurotus djamor]
MDAKLHVPFSSLKVVELKDILTKSNTSFPPKANKQDLIQRILSTPAALDQYSKQHSIPTSATDDLLALPDDVDWNEDLTSTEPAVPAEPTPSSPPKPPAPTPVAAATATETADAPPPADATPSADPELDARKRRAERFGIPLVEPKAPKPKKEKVVKSPAGVDPEKLKAREARFGKAAATTKTTPQKRAAPVDPEEEEKRKKRAERFGIKQ